MKILILLAAVVGLSSAFLTTRVTDDIRDWDLMDKIVKRKLMVTKYDVDFDLLDKHDWDKILLVRYLVKGRCFTLDRDMVRCDKDLITRLLDDIMIKKHCMLVDDDVLRCDKDLIHRIKLFIDTKLRNVTIGKTWRDTFVKDRVMFDTVKDYGFDKLWLTDLLVKGRCVILVDGKIKCDRDLITTLYHDILIKRFCTIDDVDVLRCDLDWIHHLKLYIYRVFGLIVDDKMTVGLDTFWKDRIVKDDYMLRKFDTKYRDVMTDDWKYNKYRHVMFDTVTKFDFDKLLLTDYLVKGLCTILVDGRIMCDRDLITTLYHDILIKRFCTIDGVDVLRCDLDWIHHLKLYIYKVFGVIVTGDRKTIFLDTFWKNRIVKDGDVMFHKFDKYRRVMDDDLVRDKFVKFDKYRHVMYDTVDFDKLLLTDLLVKGRCVILVDGRIKCDRDLITTLFHDILIKRFCTIDGVDVLRCDLDLIHHLKLYIYKVFGLIVTDDRKTIGLDTFWKDRIVKDGDVMLHKFDTKYRDMMTNDWVKDKYVKHGVDFWWKKDVTKYDWDRMMMDKKFDTKYLTDDVLMDRTRFDNRFIY